MCCFGCNRNCNNLLIRGPVGPQGPAGSRGAIGPMGPQGPVGPQGATGATGAVGPQGPIGPVGPQGATGATGAVGPQGPIGPVGPQGATGATGAVGPQGPAGTNDIIYASLGTATTVDTGAVIPLTLNAQTPASTMTVSNNSVNLPEAGSYLVSYFYSASGTEASSVSLYLNGALVPGETIVENANGSSSKTILLNVDGASTLTIVNTSDLAQTFNDASLTVLKAV